jgi:hypothetical protein
MHYRMDNCGTPRPADMQLSWCPGAICERPRAIEP